MRVCHFISGLDPVNGGPAIAMAGLAKAQVRAGLDVTVAATWVNPLREGVAEALTEAGVKVRLLGPCRDPSSRHPDLPGWVDDLVAGADIVHVHALWEEIQYRAARSAARRRVPYLVRPCGMLSPWSLARRKWKKKLYMAMRLRRTLNEATALHFTAAQERDLTAGLRLETPAIVEPNGVDLREFESLPAEGTFRSRYPELAGKRVVTFLGRIHLQKGLNILIPAFAEAGLPDTTLVLLGPDSDGFGPGLRRRAAEAGVSDRVIFAGAVYGRDRVAALVDSDLFVMPSYHENFGIAAVEALAAGKPVIVSDQVNIHEEIAQAGVGGVVPLEVGRLAAALREWVTGEELRREAAARTRPFVWRMYDWDEIGRRWAAHYERIVCGRN
jgi:glycosyltransferase involved in cell wall biosynthesis